MTHESQPESQLESRSEPSLDPHALIASRIRTIPDFPSPGIVFRDITPLVGDWQALALCTRLLAEPFRAESIDAVAGIEARGFIFGALVAQAMSTGFVPLRKPGKLPSETRSVRYALEYGESLLEAHVDAFRPGSRILLIDDVLATGGTAAAACELIELIGGEVAACAFVTELEGLCGRKRLGERRIHALTQL